MPHPTNKTEVVKYRTAPLGISHLLTGKTVYYVSTLVDWTDHDMPRCPRGDGLVYPGRPHRHQTRKGT